MERITPKKHKTRYIKILICFSPSKLFSNLFLFSKLFIKNHPTKTQMHFRSIQFSSHKINLNPFLVVLILPTHLLVLSTLSYWITSIQLVQHRQHSSCSLLPSNPICPIMTIELYLWHYPSLYFGFCPQNHVMYNN
jgi:hypothetical protein